jgi:hypothetical protein
MQEQHVLTEGPKFREDTFKKLEFLRTGCQIPY